MSVKEQLFKLLYMGFVEIRYQAHEKYELRSLFQISDLLHNVPLGLQRAVNGEVTYEEVMEDLREKARIKNYERHLDHLLSNI